MGSTHAADVRDIVGNHVELADVLVFLGANDLVVIGHAADPSPWRHSRLMAGDLMAPRAAPSAIFSAPA